MKPEVDAAELSFAALGALVEGDADTAGDLTALLGTESNGLRMYGVLCGLASCGSRALGILYGDRAPDVARGGRWTVEEMTPGVLAELPAPSFSLPFLVARSNQDDDVSWLLFRQLYESGPEAYVRGIGQLLADVASLCIAVLAKKDRAPAGGG